MDLRTISVESTTGTVVLAFSSSESSVCNEGEVRYFGNGSYEVTIEAGVKYRVSYQLVK